MLKSLAIQAFHDDKMPAIAAAEFVDGADARMIERRSGIGFTLQALEGHFITLQIFRQKFERDPSRQVRVFGSSHHSHATVAQLFNDAIMRNNLANHGKSGETQSQTFQSHVGQMLGCLSNQVNEP